ncbi:GGDEF domain-containing protein [Niveibacterium sp. SC-1]|uniref:GGDEF domain-containing protein n=1 Tax=Niveibacterium sp. SC-1 TaxID=3135646 RepID=UPI00311F95C7
METLQALEPVMHAPTAESVGLAHALGGWADIAERIWRARLAWPKASRRLAMELRKRTLLRGDAIDTARADLLLLEIDQVERRDQVRNNSFAGELARVFAAVGDARWLGLARLYDGRNRLNAGESLAAHRVLQSWRERDGLDADPRDQALALATEGRCLINVGRGEEGFHACYDALDRLRVLPPSPELALVVMTLGVLHLRFANFATADALFDEAWEAARAMEAHDLFGLIAANRGTCALLCGEPERTFALVDGVLSEDAPESDHAFVGLMRAYALTRLGRLPEAREMLDAAQKLVASHPTGQLAAIGRCARLALLRAEGRLDEALTELAEAEIRQPAFTTHLYELEICEEATQLHAQRGDWAQALHYERRRHERFLEVQSRAVQAEYFALQARHALFRAQMERDQERVRFEDSERTRIELEALNLQLERRMAQIEALQAELREQVIRDPLTGLHNGRFLAEILPHEVARAARERSPLSCVQLSLDDASLLREGWGEEAAERSLGEFARILEERFAQSAREDARGPGSGLCCRDGEDSFCILLPGEEAPAARERAEQALQALRALHIRLNDGRALSGLSFSAGVAQLPLASDSADLLRAAAESARARASQAGGNRVLLAA